MYYIATYIVKNRMNNIFNVIANFFFKQQCILKANKKTSILLKKLFCYIHKNLV